MSDLEELKDLLFGAEKQVLDSISERVESRELRSADVADILPEAIHDSHRGGKDLSDALRAPVGKCLQEEFRDDPQTYGDALYPVIGPAIRKSIMHALRTLAQQINEAVEQSLTPKGLAWRMQAWRAGVPFGDFVLQKTLLYRIEQAYLISRDNGLLIGHAQHEVARIKDSDAVSAMFTAIQDFVKESFSPDRTGRLETADMGEFTLWAVHGPHALLVCVIRGVPPRALRTELGSILERIHFRYADAIRSYTGDTATVPDVEGELSECLRFEARQEQQESRKRVSMPLLAVLLVVGAAITYFFVNSWLQSQKVDRLMAALDDVPGVYIAESTMDDGQLLIRGMRDPLAPGLADFVAASDMSSEDVVFDMQPFHSLAPALVAQRAVRQLGVPDGVRVTVQDSRLLVSGPAPVEWQGQVLSSITSVAGVSAVDFELSDDEKISVAREYLQPPDGVEISSVPGGVALRGTAASAWIAMAATRINAAGLDWRISLDALSDGRLSQLMEETRRLDGQQFYFSAGATLTAESELAFNAYARQVIAVAAGLGEIDQKLEITLTGFADSTGGPAVNAQVATRRAETMAARLGNLGWDDLIVTNASPMQDTGDARVDPSLRRVTVNLAAVDPKKAR